MKSIANASGLLELALPPGISEAEALEETRLFYRHMIDSAVDGFFMVDTSFRFIDVNERLCELFGYAREEWLGKTAFDFLAEESHDEIQKRMKQVATTERRRYSVIGRRKDGSVFPLLINTTTHRNSHGELVGAFGFATDLTPFEEAQRAVAESERELRRILDNMQDTYYRTDLDGRLVRLSLGVQQMLGYAPEELVGQRLADLYVDPREREDFLWVLQTGGGRVTGYEAALRHKDGRAIWVMTNAQTVRDAAGNVVGIEGTTRDISERRIAQERIDFLAHHDPLTELPNRLLFMDRFGQAIMHGRRTGRRTAMLFIDLDRFKPINDAHGHQIGDEVLREVGRRLRASVRGTDTVSRQGGDEFLVVLTDLSGGEAAAQVASKIIAVLTQPFLVDGRTMTLGASIGIALSPDDGAEFEELLRKSDEAMYRAKHAGGNAYRFYGCGDPSSKT